MTTEEQQGYKMGLMKQMLARIRSAPVWPDGAGANPTRFMHFPAIQNRLQSVDDIGRIYRVRNEVLAGSITSPNQMARREFADAVPDDLLQDIMQQRPVAALINQAARRLNKARYGLSNKSARQVATMLFESDPAKKALYLERLMGAAKKGSKGINPETVASRKLQAYFDFDDALASRMGRATKLTAPGVIYEQRNTGNNDGSGTGSGTERPSGMVPQRNDNVNAFSGLAPQKRSDAAPVTVPRPAMFMAQVPDRVREKEGLRLDAYNDPIKGAKARTVGYGFNMDSGIAKKLWKRAGVQADFGKVYKGQQSIDEQDAESLLQAAYDVAREDAEALFPDFASFSPARREALVDLSYQLGRPNLEKFTSMRAAINKGNWVTAARHLLKSQYAQQVPQRARENAKMLLRS